MTGKEKSKNGGLSYESGGGGRGEAYRTLGAKF